MKKILLIVLLFCLSLPVFSTVESRPTIDLRNFGGYGVAQYGTREDNEHDLSKYKYDYITVKGNKVYARKAPLISCLCRDMASNGIVYEEPSCRIKENGSTWQSLTGWIKEDYGTYTEYNVQWAIEPLRQYVYAINSDNNVVKYKIVKNKYKNKVKQVFYGDFETYEPVSYFVQTEIGKKIKKQGMKFDENGKMITPIKQSEFSEIVEYDMQGNILFIYRKNEYDRINEYYSDGKTLKSNHNTDYIPYLQWVEDENTQIYKKIEDFKPIFLEEAY